jgi:spermidine/putrescine transport system substrate-binding protein
MTLHPRENRGPNRRQFLQLGALSVAASSGLLAGCGRERPGRTPAPGEQIVLSRPDHPTKLPLHADVTAIADGMSPETGGVLKVFNYPEYLAPDLIKAFGKEYKVTVEVTTFSNMEEAIAKLRTAGTRFDVFFPTPDILGKAVAGKLLQPLNHTYVPNLKNAWTQLQDPFYDQGALYTVPYNAYTTGIGYRADRVTTVPPNGYGLCWDTANKGKVYILDDPREPLVMAMLRIGQTDVNTEDRAVVEAAGRSLATLVDAVNVKTGIAAYQLVAEGQATVHPCWSGDMNNAQYYLPKGVESDVLGYWYPADLKGVVGTDSIAIPASAEKPVLAHTFINYLLDNDNALTNFGYTGYQPALTSVTPEKMVADEYVPEHLKNTIVTPTAYATGMQILQLSPAGDALWNDTWAAFKAGH